MPHNGQVNEKFGVYRSLCCGAEIVITKGAIFPRCPDHPRYTLWKLLPDGNNILDASHSIWYSFFMKTPKTLKAAIEFFLNPMNCIAYLAASRWPDGQPVCPVCGRNDVTFIESRQKFQCKARHLQRQFSIKVGTIFEDSPISLDKWLLAVWMITNCKNGVSSYEIHRDIGVTQKTAWFMLHRIRLAMQGDVVENFGGEVEVDETYIGGAARFMHRDKREARAALHGRTGGAGKTAVFGLLERAKDGNSKVRARPVTFAHSYANRFLSTSLAFGGLSN